MTTLLLCLALLVASAAFSGSETGFYTLSRLRLDADAAEGRVSARLIRWLLRDDGILLITLLIGNNLVLELLTHTAEEGLRGRLAGFGQARELVLAAVLTPVVFLFGELLPKDLFHRRPNALVSLTAPFVAVARVLFAPLAFPLRTLSALLERSSGLGGNALTRALGREAVIELIEESARLGALSPHAELLARNALELQAKPLSSVLVPWKEVRKLPLEGDPATLFERVVESSWSRLPVIGEGGRVVGYVHQLDVLGDAQRRPLATYLRPIASFAPDLSIDRALARLRIAGQRVALVGTPDRPLGLVSLKDLVEAIAGDLASF